MEKKKSKGVTPVFVGKNGYYIAKLDSIKPVKLADVHDLARNIVYSIKQQKSSNNWLKSERKNLSIIIHLKNYQEKK